MDIVRAAIDLTLSGALADNIAASAERAGWGLLAGGSIGFFWACSTACSGPLNGFWTPRCK
ncbi:MULTISPECIES: hypothetical protein [Methylomicrobium]|uniref:hypothetical protein n=1 Tax=Methylomicrobium TaxID=39773 RepID=UPI00020D8C15|nr:MULTISPECIES: hypothetical protein [Methylomicrobium]